MWLYQVLLKCLKPVLMKKVRRYQASYSNYRLEEVFGNWPETKVEFWLHCASVGEVLAAKELVARWLAAHPQQTLLLTTVTPTGAEQAIKLFGNQIVHRYLPMDYPAYVNKALSQVQCRRMAIIEMELWPNLLKGLKAKNIPICIVNARMSEKSAKNYKRFSGFSRKLFALPDLFLAHHENDAARFVELGARHVEVSGSIKFDVTLSLDVLESDWREALGSNRFVWIGASTHDGEDEVLLAVHKTLKNTFPNALLILVPRHPERFESVTKLANQFFSKVEKRSDDKINNWCEADVLIGDSMGELMHYYQASDLAFVGGSLIERGGHNPIEPAVLGKPILVGLHTFNFKEITQSLIEEGGALRCEGKDALVKALIALSERDNRVEMGQKALVYAQKNQGALERTLEHIEELTSV
ncbi:3-deoxy-D-manno-octulosonic acid transferase [Marinomonas mediterranea]|uniref:3-deoxy-D-manno-octulosonic acid transferase n=1 Tax=Marinomonas mediterranea TaxID=119864 RepID=UPI00234BF65A|nr:3-deoxy-D-manno-octulosonic acid transferase [Marinomonas mediterranea]WCN14485.1 3-deoxy-D-manno-octulosonic acid transferase [Marinomonas mediterranea]